MENIYTNTELHRALATFLLTMGGFLAYHGLSGSGWVNRRNKEITEGGTYELSLFLTRKTLGFLFLGLIPAIIFFVGYGYPGYSAHTLNIPSSFRWLIYTGICLLILVMVYFPARKQEFHERIPEMRLDRWNMARFGILVGGWAVYLFAYEFLFRELLLFTWVEALGIIPAIVLNTILYAMAHLPKGIQEVKGSVVFGPLLCMGSLISGSFITPFIWHLVLAVSSELYAIYFNPAMQIKLNPK